MEKISNRLTGPKNSSPCYFYENDLWAQQAYLCGMDEVGRGPLAGPVVTAAVILKPFCTHPLLVDSKILTEKKRLEAFSWIIKNSWYSYGIVDATLIDTVNIYQATQIAMKQALYGLFSQNPGPWATKLLLIDAVDLKVPFLAPDLKILSFPYGESRSASIAAASILAKVKRDELISRMATIFPGYGFEQHKGYGTQAHQAALQAKGLCLIHRKTFLKGLKNHEDSDNHQTTLFC